MAKMEEELLDDYFKKISAEAELTPDIKLDSAIRIGMLQGNSTRTSFRKRYAVLVIAVLALAFFIIVPWANPIKSPVQTQLPPKSWGGLEIFRPTIANNLTMTSALDAGMMKEVNISAEEDGIKWTVNGILADHRGIALLYTLENNTDQKMSLMGLSLKKSAEDTFDLTGYSGFSTSDAQEVGSPGTTRMFEQIVWNKYRNDLKDEVNLTLTLFSPSEDPSKSSSLTKKFSVKIPLKDNYNFFQGEVIDLKDSLSIADQKIIFDQVYIGPTGIYIRENFGRGNTMRIFSVLSPKLIIGKGENQEILNWSSGASSENGGLKTHIFHNENRRPDDPIKLEIEGISALDKSKVELVINTETREILKAPDEYLTISKRMENEEQGVIALELFTPNDGSGSYTSRLFSLDSNFVDGSGSGHWLERAYDDNEGNGYKELGDTKGSTISVLYNVGKEKLPQPLTFKFSNYPNVIKEKASLRIR